MALEVAVDAHGLFDGPSYTEAHFSALTGLLRGSGVARGEDNECAPSVSSANVRIATGKVFTRGFYGTISSNKDVTPSAAHASLNRIDRVVLRLDRSDNEITVGVVTGTAAASPSAPALTQNATIWETRLAQVLVAGGSGTLTVTDEREYARGIGEPEPATIKMWAGTTEPAGWLGCAGQAISRITYWELFAQTGTSYGVGNGTTTFNIPDLRGRAGFGADNMFALGSAFRLDEPNDLGETGGDWTHTLTEAEMPSHAHAGASGFSVVVGSLGTSTLSLNTSADIDHGNADVTYSTTSEAGADTAFSIMPPYQICNYLVKV